LLQTAFSLKQMQIQIWCPFLFSGPRFGDGDDEPLWDVLICDEGHKIKSVFSTRIADMHVVSPLLSVALLCNIMVTGM
jgi:hypothetical protein